MKRALKQIPTEYLAGYTSILGVLGSMDNVHDAVYLVVFLATLAMVPIGLRFLQDVKPWWHLLSAAIVFIFWDMTIPNGLFAHIPDWKTGYGTISLMLFGFGGAPLIAKYSKKQPDANTVR